MTGARRPMPIVADLARPRPPQTIKAIDPERWDTMSQDEQIKALWLAALDFHERLKTIERDTRTEF